MKTAENVALRSRGTRSVEGMKDQEGNPENSGQSRSGDSSPHSVQKRKRDSLAHRLRTEWDSLFWIIAAFAVLYFTNFASTLLLSPKVKSAWLAASILHLSVSVGCMVYAILYRPSLTPHNWLTTAPRLIPTATITGITGGICLAVAVWPVWTFLTLFILPTLFMGFISSVSLFGL